MKKKTFKIFGAIILIAVIVAASYFLINGMSFQTTEKSSLRQQSTTEYLKDRGYIDDLRITDVIRLSNDENDTKYKSYDSSTREILIEDKDYNLIIKMRLTSPYVVSGLVASSETKVAEFYLEDWKDGTKLMDTINFYDVKDNYKSTDKTFRFKYGTDYQECFEINISKEQECYNHTYWKDFKTLDELTHKNIKISLWANTEASEKIEWIPTIEGFEILQWAEWDISTASYLQNFSVASEQASLKASFFKPDGTKMYATGGGAPGQTISEYDLSVAWNISTAVYLHNISVEAGETGPKGVFFKPDGTKVYFIGSTLDLVHEGDLSTPWDVTSVDWIQNFSFAPRETDPSGFYLNPDGDKMYIIGTQDKEINEYDLSVAWDISSAVWLQLFSVEAGEANPGGVFFKPDGTKVYFHGSTLKLVHEGDLSTPWDVTSVDWIQNFSIAAQETEPFGIFFSPDGTNMYIGGFANILFQYDLPLIIQPPDVTLNYPGNNTGFIVNQVEFNCSATHANIIENVSLYIDGEINHTVVDGVGNKTELNITLTFGESKYNWTCDATDDINQRTFAGNRTFSIDTIDPVMDIIFPTVNNSNWTIDTLDINFTRSDANLDSCWYSNDTYLANTTLASCGNVTDVVWSQGNHNITIWVNDTAGHEVSDGISFSIDSIFPDINITSPINNTNWTVNIVDVNYSVSDTNLAYCWYSNDTYEVNKTLASCGNVTDVVWSEGNHNVTIWANDTYGNENASRISFTIDTIAPEVNITYPINLVSYQEINTNLTVNYSASDLHLSSCWGSFDGGTNNISLTCADQNISRNITSVNNDTFTFWANDTLGNVGNITRTWIYRVFENQQTYSSITIPGSTETFVNNIFLGSGETITEVNFNYNGTDRSAGYSNLGGNEYNLSSTFVIPSIEAATNITFFWKIDLISEQINTSLKNQSIRNIEIDDCSVFTTLMFNYTIVGEESQVKLIVNTSLELDIAIYDASKTTLILNFSKKYIDTNPATVCLNINLTEGTSYALDSTAKYEAANSSIEYYNIQNFLLQNATIPQHIKLYDLLLVDATEFQITFKDSNFVVVENALVQINRQYVSEGLFKTVEIPKTDSNGQTVAHLVEKDIVYNIIVLKEGEVIGTFNNVIAFCEDVLIGSCFISLNALEIGEVSFDYDEDIGLFFDFDYNETSRNLQFDFATDDGSVKNVTLFAIKFDQLGDTAVCEGYLISSSGSIYCPVPASVGNETIIVSIWVDGDLKITNYIDAGREFDIGDAGYFLMFFLVLSLALMMTQSKTGVVVGVILGFISGILLSLIQGGLIGIGSSVIWLVIMGIILIYKLNSKGQT